jgi:hypothetical protein
MTAVKIKTSKSLIDEEFSLALRLVMDIYALFRGINTAFLGARSGKYLT